MWHVLPQQVKRINVLVSVGNSFKQMQQTSGSSFLNRTVGDESAVNEVPVVLVVFFLLMVCGNFLSLSPSFLDCGGGIDEVVVVVVVSFLSFSLAFFFAFFSCTNLRCPS